MSRQEELRIRVNKLEKQKLQEEAEKRGMTVSDLVRYLARQLWDKPGSVES